MPKLVRSERDESLTARVVIATKKADSVKALADAIGRSEGAIRKWQRGDGEPNATDVKHLCKETGVRAQWLIDGSEPQDCDQAKYVVERSGDDIAEFYRKEFVLEVAQKFAERLKEKNLWMKPDDQARLLLEYLMIFKSQPAVEVSVMDIILDRLLERMT